MTRDRPAAASVALFASLILAGRPAHADGPTPVRVGRAPLADATTVVLCPDIGVKQEVFVSRGHGGLGITLAEAGLRVLLVDPWVTSTAHSDGFDGVVRDVFPELLASADALAGGAPLVWVGHGLCGLLPLAAAAAPNGGRFEYRWVALGTRFDYRLPPSSWETWLRAWSDEQPPLPDAILRSFLTGLRAPLGGRSGSAPPTLPQDVPPGDTLLRFVSKEVLRPPPKAVVDDVLRWFDSGGLASRSGWVDYARGYESVRGPAAIFAGATDPVAPPEDVLPAVDKLGDRVVFRYLSRASGDVEDYGHLGMLLSRHAAQDVDSALMRFLRGASP